MSVYADAFEKTLKSKDLKFNRIDDRAFIISFGAENKDNIEIIIAFDKDGDHYVALKCYKVAKFNAENVGKGIVCANEQNAKFRWVKFYIDDDMEVTCEADGILTEETAGDEAFELMIRMLNIVDEAYLAFMKAVLF